MFSICPLFILTLYTQDLGLGVAHFAFFGASISQPILVQNCACITATWYSLPLPEGYNIFI